ncbi:MAG TPA: phenylalanine--tRNA ligase subunit beta, partial [Vicinamibacterales bacterium]|nr:phenylalanine--tRNA ligase subunit beta [Vicinamibacterales bacterium]
NRPDCLSVLGLAREAAVAFDAPFADPIAQRRAAGGSDGPPGGATAASGTGRTARFGAGGVSLDIHLEEPELCARYAALVARVRVGPSPERIARRLAAAGIRPINNVVDVTNYVMIERGHPTHAFDLERLEGRALRIRRARPGETIRTLDGVDRRLDPETLVIADGSRPQAVAGVMGGAASEVSAATRLVAVESAWFLPRAVRRAARRLDLRTEASARFERGADLGAPVVALRRVAELLAATGAGEPLGPPLDLYPAPAAPREIVFPRAEIPRLLGAAIADDEVERILRGLGFRLSPRQDGWRVGVPTWRPDVARPADLVEEVARHHGYDRLPTTFPPLTTPPAPPDPRVSQDRLARRVLTAAGFTEAVTFTFIARAAAAPFLPQGEAIALANPLAETFAVLRPSLVPGLLDALAHNRRRGRQDVRLFEIGAGFPPGDGERRRVAFVWSGRAVPEHWSGGARAVDFFDASGAAVHLCTAFGVPVRLAPGSAPYLVEGRTARLVAGDDAAPIALGLVGQIAPSLVEARDVPRSVEVFAAEIDLEQLGRLGAGRDLVRVEPPPRHPAVVRDLAVHVPETLPAADVRGTIRAAAPATLVEIVEFDRYQGPGVPEGRVSLAFHLTFRAPDRTLVDAEVDAAMAAIVEALVERHGAVRR